MLTKGLMSSNTDEWATPPQLFEVFNEKYHFTLDVCANADNHKCPRYFDKSINGLDQDWTKDICWLNPPYGRTIGQWVKKASITASGGGVVVALLPARTDTKWWRYVMTATEIIFLDGRVKFGNSKNSAPFPSVIVIWGTPRVPVISSLDIRQLMGGN